MNPNGDPGGRIDIDNFFLFTTFFTFKSNLLSALKTPYFDYIFF
jgi:hypothetical protein